MLTAKMGVNVNVFDKRELVAAIKQCMGVWCMEARAHVTA